MEKKPNILFFLTDDQRHDTIAALGNNEIKTPNIDRLVRNGTTFNQAHIPCGTVGAICMPSRAMIHTGRTLFHIENDGQNIPDKHALIGETFKLSGYNTFGTGKWHNCRKSFTRSFSDGDEIFFGGMSDHWNVPVYHYDLKGEYETKLKYIEEPEKNNLIKYNYCDHVHAGKHSSELFCEAAREWLINYDSKNPFFLYIAFMAPHDPRSMPDEFLKMYDPDEIDLPENFMPQHEFDYGIYNGRDEVLSSYPRNPDSIRKHIAEYYGMISHLDCEIGKTIDALKATGKYEDTVIVLAGDNGLALGQHGLMGKQNGYEHSIRVPLVLAGPGIPKGEIRDTYAYLLDLFPTLCEIVGIDIPASVEGRSLMPAIKDNNIKIRDSIYFAYGSVLRGIKNSQYKLIEYRVKNLRKTQLFDIVKDPAEMNNLSHLTEYEDIKKDLTNRLLEYKNIWDDEKHEASKKFWSRYNDFETLQE